MNTKHQKTLKAVFSNPVNGNLEWRKIEALLVALGAKVVEGDGSRASFFLNGAQVDIHRPTLGRRLYAIV